MSEKRLYGECPNCEETFPLTKAHLFYGKPVAEPALNTVNEWAERLEASQRDLAKQKLQARDKSKQRVIDVNVGKVIEKIAPALPGFSFDCHDCRGLFEPVDYVIFEGLTQKGTVESIQLIDIKTGQSQLKPHQRQIKEAIENRRVEWKTYEKVI
jgi:predicted Holliday junction resolvase-like endonuclease